MQFTREDILFPFTFHVFWVCYTEAATLRMKCERINTMKTKYEQYSWGGDSEFGLRGWCLLTPAWLFWRSWGVWTTVQGQMVLVVSHCVGKIMKVFGNLWRPKRPLNWLGFHIDTRYPDCFLGILTLESCLEQEKKIYMLHSTVSMERRIDRKSLIEKHMKFF